MMHQYYPVSTHGYKYELNRDMNFAAAHFNPHKDTGKSHHMHGHTFVVNVTMVGDELEEDTGFLANFGIMNELISDKFDHSVLNDHPEFMEGPTTEVIAKTLYHIIEKALKKQKNNPKCLQVMVRENPTSYVIYKG